MPLPDGSIDFDAADTSWAATTDATVPTETAGKRQPEPKPGRPEAPAAKHAPVDNANDADSFMSARTRREQAEASRAELKLAQEQRELLPAADVRGTLTQIGKIYASGRSAVPAQLATQLVGKTDLGEIERIIQSELNAADRRICSEVEARFRDYLDDGNPGDR